MGTTPSFAKKPFVSTILLWMRTDQLRQVGMGYWKGPHSKIISATPGLGEYRQIHLAENNPGLWPAISGVETVIPGERRIDGVAEVTFASALSPLRGRKQTKLAYKDEVNVFRRTLLYAGRPRSARWYDVARPEEKVGARSLIYLRKREDTRTRAFRKFLMGELVPALAGTGALRELRSQFGFADAHALGAFYGSEQIAVLSGKLPEFVSAVHAYEVAEALTYVKDGAALPHPQA